MHLTPTISFVTFCKDCLHRSNVQPLFCVITLHWLYKARQKTRCNVFVIIYIQNNFAMWMQQSRLCILIVLQEMQFCVQISYVFFCLQVSHFFHENRITLSLDCTWSKSWFVWFYLYFWINRKPNGPYSRKRNNLRVRTVAKRHMRSSMFAVSFILVSCFKLP